MLNSRYKRGEYTTTTYVPTPICEDVPERVILLHRIVTFPPSSSLLTQRPDRCFSQLAYVQLLTSASSSPPPPLPLPPSISLPIYPLFSTSFDISTTSTTTMRFARHLPSLLALALPLPSLVSASFNCEAVQDGVVFDFRALKGSHSVTLPPSEDPVVVRTLLLPSSLSLGEKKYDRADPLLVVYGSL